MANQQPHYSYRPVMNRNVTRKWAEARQVNYGGDDWGDDGYGGPSPDQEPAQHPLSHGQRSFTNPLVDTRQRMSFDREAENRNFSAGPGPAPTLPQYGSAQPNPYTAAAGPRYYNEQQQQQQPMYEQPQYPQTRAPEAPGRTSIDSFRRDAPRPESRESANVGIHPPRKSSLGQNDFKDYSQPETLQTSTAQSEDLNAKPLPIIRPADIWKRHEEAEKERRSQESSTRPSVDSARRNSGEKITTPPVESEQSRRRQPALDTVAERKSEYLDNLVNPLSQPESRLQNISGVKPTEPLVSKAPVLPSESLPDEPKQIPASIAPVIPTSTVTESRSVPAERPALPQISRTSTFGPDFLYSAIPTNQPQAHEISQLPSTKLPSTNAHSDFQRDQTQPYTSMVQSAFDSENRRRGDSSTTASLLRTNTTSTSDISPIVGTSTNDSFERSQRGNVGQVHDLPRAPIDHTSDEEMFHPPRRVNTDRRESPSPARRPLSLVAPDIPEPLSAITSPDEHAPAPDTARAAQVVRPGLANLVHQRGPSKDLISNERNLDTRPQQQPQPQPQTQGSMDSDTSARSNERTTSEEWASWNAARSEAHARHGIPDSKPSTPGFSSSKTSTPAPAFESLDHNMHMPSGTGETGTKAIALPIPPTQRPQVARDESFRPSLPGGWMSSDSIQKATTSDLLASQPRPPLAQSTESTESIPTATAPRDANWRSRYRTGTQGDPLADASAAGAQMAGIFNGPSLTLSRRPDSEVSSIDEGEEGPTGLHRDVSMKSRDFAASPEPPHMSAQSASRDFAATSPLPSDVTPKAKQVPFGKHNAQEKPALALPGQAAYSLPAELIPHDSPTKESERWWSSEDEAEPAPAPAPLRTNRLSTIEPSHASISPVSRLTDTDTERLESDIVKSLTPKSSKVNTAGPQTEGISSIQERDTDKSVSPPFAAAALAVSPGRDYKALEEQNAFQPLTTPSSKTISPISQKTGQLAVSIPPLPSTTSDTQPSPITSRSNAPPPPITLPKLTSHDRASEAPSLPAFDAAKAPPTNIHGPQSGTKTTSNDLVHESESAVPSSRPDRSISTQPLSSSSGVPLTPLKSGSGTPLTSIKSGSPVVAQFHGANTVNEAVTMPTPKAPATSDLTRDQPITPAKHLPKPVDNTIKPIGRQASLARSEVSAMSTPATPIVTKTAAANRSYDPLRTFPSDKFTNEQINNMPTASHRINAYNENRTAYAEPIGHLENWLTHMNTSDRADAFSSRPLETSAYTSSDRFDKRDPSAPPSATKSVDGKKMLASASKMGQKASVLGKGLFSKGKEKLRTASASQKGSSASQSTDKIVPDTRQPSTTSISNPPQLPEPSIATPLEESSLSAYFAGRDGSTTTTNERSIVRTSDIPPFSPISEVSSNQIEKQKTLDRAVSAVSEQQSPQSTSTARPSTTIARTVEEPRIGTASSQTVSGGPRASMDLLRADAPVHQRRDSSVSDVSSVSDRLVRNQSQATRTISPQVNPEPAHDISAPPTRNISTSFPVRETQPQKTNPLATNMAATTLAPKEVEALQDRVEEQTLPAYEQAKSPPPPRITPGAQIIPIGRISQNQDQEATSSSRPFSFVGNESLSKTGYPTHQSIDNPGVGTGISGTRGTDSSPAFGQQNQQTENPLPSARRNPEDYAAHARTPEEFARLRQNAPPIQTKPEEPSGFRIPGPYGQELRSPKPKSSSPMLEHSHTTPPLAAQGELYSKPLPSTNISAASPYDGRGNLGGQSYQPQMYESRPGAPAVPVQSYHDPNRPMEHNSQPQYQQEPDVDAGLRHRRSLATSLAEHERDQAEERRERSRSSKLSSIFRPRSRSRSRRLRKEQAAANYTEQRPAPSKRNSLNQTQSRNSVPQARPQPPGQAPSWYNDEVSNHDTQSGDRPGPGSRRLSKDLFKHAQYGQHGLSQPQYNPQPRQQQQLQPLPVATGKKKRFSGLFSGKSYKTEQAPHRAQNMPMNDPQRPPPQQQQQFHSPHGYQHQSQQQFQPSQSPPPQMLQQQSHAPLGYHQQTTMPHGYAAQPSQIHEHDRQNSASHGGVAGQQFHGMQPSAEGYYGYRPDQPDRQSSQPQYGQQFREQRLPHSTDYAASQQQTSMPYQDSLSDQYGLGYNQGRPDLSRLNTGERTAPTSLPFTAPHGSHAQQQTSHHHHDDQQIYSAPVRTSNVGQEIYQPPSTRANKDISYGSDLLRSNTQDTAPVSAPPVPVQSHTSSSAASGSKITPRVAALHTRSRSPKLGRRDSSDLNEEFSAIQNSHSPVAGLGAFHNKTVSPTDGVPRHEEEQEKPFVIGLPGMQGQRDSIQDDPNSASSARAREMRRIMLERNSADQGIASPQNSAGQTVADRFMGIPASAPQPSRQSMITSPPPVRNVMISKNPSLRGREPVNRSTSTTPVNNHTTTNGHSILGSPTSRGASLATAQPPVPPISTAKAVQTPVSAPPVPPPPKAVPPRIPPPRAITPPEPSISPPPPPTSKAAAPTTTNEAGVTKTLPTPRAGKSIEMHELPGSRPDGYESEEEIVMSATAFPGQEWMPVFDRWED